MDKISIIITAFNRKEYLMDALRSIENQSVNGYLVETLIVKNFLDDEIDKYIDNHNYIALEGSETPLCDYVYQGLLHSNGKFIFFLEDDDIFLSDKIAFVMDKMKEFDLDFYHNSFSPRDNNSNIIKGKLYKQTKRSFLIDTSTLSKRDVRRIMNNKGDINLSSMCLNKRIVDHKFDKLPRLGAGPDWFMLFSALENGKRLYFDNSILSIYRIHNSTVNSYESDLNLLIGKRENLLQKEIFSLGLMKETFISPLIKSIIDERITTDILQLNIIKNEELKSFSGISIRNFLKVRRDSMGIGVMVMYFTGLIMPRLTRRLYFKIFQRLTFGT